MLRGPTVNRCAVLVYRKRIDGCEHEIDEWIQSKADARTPEVAANLKLGNNGTSITSDWSHIRKVDLGREPTCRFSCDPMHVKAASRS
jgi:hypothetical protein